MVFSGSVDWDENRVTIGSYITPANVGERTVEEIGGKDVGGGDDGYDGGIVVFLL